MGEKEKERKDGEEKSPHSAATVCVSGLPYSITNAQPLDERQQKLKEVVVVDDDERWLSATDKMTNGSASTSNVLVNSSIGNVNSGNIAGSDTSLQEYDEEDSSRYSSDIDNQTPLDVVAEEEEELWRQMAFAQESIKVTVENSQSNDLKQVEDCDHYFIFKDDIGEVCCVCGLIKTPIERMIEVVFNKAEEIETNLYA